jgi:histone-lysine N-methyltransferase SETDB1
LGDEYFAEIDFIDCMKRLRDGSSGLTSENSATISNADSENSNESCTSNKRRDNRKTLSVQKLNNVKHDLNQSTYHRPKQQQNRQKLTVDENNIETIWLEDSDDDDFGKRIQQQNKQDNNTKNQKLNKVSLDFTEAINQMIDSSEPSVFIMDAKLYGNIGRYFNHSCSPNIFVQNVFVDTHDLRFPWISFFASNSLKAGTELCWDYNYTIGSVPNRELYCHCGSSNCRGRLL